MKVSRRLGCCLAPLVGIALVTSIAALCLWLWADSIFSVRSNLMYLAFRNSKAPVKVSPRGGEEISLGEISPEAFGETLRTRFEGPGYRWRTLSIRREPAGRRQRVADLFFSAQVHVLELSPNQFSLETAFRKNPDKTFAAWTAGEVLDASTADNGVFAINASYFDPEGQPLGLIVHRGETVNREFKAWSGFFFVKDEVPRFGPRSLFEKTPGTLTEVAQGYPSVMKDGKIFHYLETAPNRFFNGKERTFRALAGVKSDGTVVFVLSGRGGLLEMAEVSKIAQLCGVQHATLLDGGRSLQYRFDHQGDRFSFHAFNNRLEMNGILDNRLTPERPPVYLLVRSRPE